MLKKILVVKLSALGDVIHALPVSYAIKETFPDAHLTWVVEPPAYDIVKMNPCVDKIIIFRKKEFRTLKGFARNFFPFKSEIQAEDYDAVLDLQGLFKSAAIAFFAKSNIKLGVCDMRELSGQISKPVIGENARGHIVDRYLDTARAIGCRVDKVVFPLEIPADAIKKADAISEQAGLVVENPYVALAVGASWETKRWSAENFAALSDWFYSVEVTPVLIGNGAAEEQIAAEISAKSKIPPINLVGKTNLMELSHVLKNSRIVIGGDTGTTHLSTALGVRTLMIMGPTQAARTGPYGQIQNALEVDRDCKYCRKRICPKGENCLSAVTVDAVINKILSIK